MKNILISGNNSYVGTSFIEWINLNRVNDYNIETISLKNNHWKNKELNHYDTIIHLAAIVHAPSTSRDIFYSVNRDLTIEFAKKAKREGVLHFIFFSTLSVYGVEEGEINHLTQPNPINDYGKSKLEAELELLKLEDTHFKISIIRPPMIYGPNCPGNFSRLIRVFNHSPLFLNVNNKRSMLFIDNLSAFLHQIIKHKEIGIFFPQNKDYVQTSAIFYEFKKTLNKNCLLIPFIIPKFILKKNKQFNKIFGDLIVEKRLSEFPFEYKEVGFKKSIEYSISRGTNFENKIIT